MTGILTLNAGSSSIKFGLYNDAPEPEQLVDGQVDGIGGSARLELHAKAAKTSIDVDAPTQAAALEVAMRALSPHMSGLEISGIGHRIVHGGMEFVEPVVLTQDILDGLAELEPLAPLHQPHNLAGVAAARAAFPNAVQIGCFDTAFHRGHPWVNDTFALPRSYYEQGIRRYGFHGLSYNYITGVIAERFPDLHKGRIIVAHLGNGASMCAIRQGKSVGSTMGFSALDGLPMGTRCGQIDPGVVLHLITQKGMAPQDLMHMLYHESGLLGLSGFTGDMRELLASDRKEARQAIDYYVFRARREIGALSAVLCGVDALVFCGGVGENAGPIRERIVEGLDYLGIGIDPERNSENALDIGNGRTRVMVIPTDEERVIARAVHRKKHHGTEDNTTRRLFA
ncbi:acetate/propionate family kinase [Hoeflea prorocentri]|uniref:Acetate kinase n=1 Tax=Hoeflea prorocentri TaxID=1922333 RepID=A0A9X3UI08_9HYPH|nr:acetate/propionate family kinase [Hoeflea prorocentri]MCY6379564.1 acetate/propionate family kinase [Hoeflea prorocentri]MDA5397364.1 acetate/propionate family kinase [Hoeflea prorocentri]